MKRIHPSAIVKDGATLGDDVQAEAYAFVNKETKIGNGVIIKQGARISADTTIGDESRIFSYACVGDIPQDISYKEEQKMDVVIGKNATIRESATVDSGTARGDGFTRVGNNAFIMTYCHIAHDCILGHHIILANNATLVGHVKPDDYAVVGGLTPIHQFVKVGEGTMIAGASALSQDIVPFYLAEGNRASIRSLNLVGIRRRFEKDEAEYLSKAYEFLSKNETLKEDAKILLKEAKSENVKKMYRFILETERGIPVYKGKNNG